MMFTIADLKSKIKQSTESIQDVCQNWFKLLSMRRADELKTESLDVQNIISENATFTAILAIKFEFTEVDVTFRIVSKRFAYNDYASSK